jgi:hypothetical protein
MPLPSAIKLFIDPRTGSAFGNFSGTSSLSNPVFTLGDTATVEVYLVEDTGLSAYPRQEIGFPTSPGIKVAVGAIDESPQAGTWTLSYGGDTTTALAFNATPAVVQAALNLLASITAAGGVSVSKIGDNYNILFNANGARTELTTNGAALIPLSAATVATLQTGDTNKPTIYLVHLQRTVAGLATSFNPTAPSAITVTALTAWDGSKATFRVSISPDPKGGSFSLAFDALTGTDVSTPAISVGATALDVQNALSIGALADGKVSVTQVKAYAYDISVTVQPGTGGLTANDAGLLSFSGYKGEINLNTAEAISLLDGAPFAETTLEVEITSESKTLTVLQIPCILHNAVIDAGAVQPLVLDTYLSQNTADGRYFKLSQNLADGTAGTMRTNLAVYSTSQVDTALALKANVIEPSFSGKITTPTVSNVLNSDLVIDSYNDTGAGTHYLHKFTPFDGKLVLATNGGGLTFPDGTTQSTAFTGTAATSWGTITGSLTSQTDLSNALAGKANLSGAAFTGNLTLTGRAAIGGGLANNAAHKLAIYDGNIVFSSGFGLAFGDGTTQTTAGVLNGGSASLTTINLAPEGGFWEGSQLTKENYKTYFDNASSNAQTTFTQEGLFKGDEIRLKRQTFTEKQNDPGAYDLTQDFGLSINPSTGLSFLKNNNTQIVGTVRYEPTGVRWSDGTITTTPPVTSVAGRTGAITLGVADVSGAAPLANPVFTGDARAVTPATSDNDTSIATTAFVKAQGYLTTAPVTSVAGRTGVITLGVADVSGAAALAGDTFTGKVNFTSVAGVAGLNIGIGGTPAASTNAGDLWIATGGATLNYRDGTNTGRIVAALNNANQFTSGQAISVNSVSNALRIEQRGTGAALIVEDSTTPDTSAFVVDASGNVGVGVTASTFSPTNKVEVVGSIKTDTITFDGTAQFKVNGTQSHASGSYTHDLLISFGGSTYRLPMALVSTP